MPEQSNVTMAPDLQITLAETGRGRPVLVLHGGGGPATVANLAAHLAARSRVLVPTHPGWNGAPRPPRIATVADLAAVYLDLIRNESLNDVVLVGSSIGGWLAAEMAATDNHGLIGHLVLVDAGGILVEGEPMRNFFALDPREIAEYSFHDPDRFYIDPATLPPDRVTMMRANMVSLRDIAGEPYMHDPTLMGRLRDITAPTLVIWGDSDRIFTPGYGRAMAAAIPGARFELIAAAGHLPHLEQADNVFGLLDSFIG